jgi:2-oxo-3-hexenedioate decarboxylase
MRPEAIRRAPPNIGALAAHLHDCELQARDTVKITDEAPGLTWDEAYAIQDAICQRKLQRGAQRIGYKAGFTSFAKMRQMGVGSPIFGFLVDSGRAEDGAEIPIAELIHPKVEPEIVFRTRTALRGPGCHAGAVLAATEAIFAGLEVIDSRYRDFKFDLPSVIADNTSAARFALGRTATAPDAANLRTLGVVVTRNDVPVAFAAGAAIVGHPASAVAMLVNHLAARGRELPAGSLVLSGGMTEAVAVSAGDRVCVHLQHLGTVSTSFR